VKLLEQTLDTDVLDVDIDVGVVDSEDASQRGQNHLLMHTMTPKQNTSMLS